EFDAERAVKALDLARGDRRPWLGQDVVDPVLPTDAVKQHLHRRLRIAPGEHLAVVGQDLLWNSGVAERRSEALAYRLSSLRGHQPGRDAVPGVVVDASQGFGAGAI